MSKNKFDVLLKKMKPVRIKPIMPSLKENKRYVVFEVLSERKIDRDLSGAILKQAQSTMGIFDSAKAGIMSVDYNIKTQRGVLRVATKGLDKLRTSLALISQLNDEELAVRTIGVSGIMKKAKSKYFAS